MKVKVWSAGPEPHRNATCDAPAPDQPFRCAPLFFGTPLILPSPSASFCSNSCDATLTPSHYEICPHPTLLTSQKRLLSEAGTVVDSGKRILNSMPFVSNQCMSRFFMMQYCFWSQFKYCIGLRKFH